MHEPTSSDASIDPAHPSKSASTTVFSPSSDGTSRVLPTHKTTSSVASTSAYFHHPLVEDHPYYQRVNTSVLLYLHVFQQCTRHQVLTSSPSDDLIYEQGATATLANLSARPTNSVSKRIADDDDCIQDPIFASNLIGEPVRKKISGAFGLTAKSLRPRRSQRRKQPGGERYFLHRVRYSDGEIEEETFKDVMKLR